MTDSLRSRTVNALFWSFLESVGQRAVQVLISIVLARLLFPEQFGLIGMLTIFMATGQAFLDSGFGAALVQKRDATPTDVCSIFYFNIAAGAATASLLCLAAPLIAAFYNQPILVPLIRVLSLTVVINSVGLIHSITLTREINFKTQAAISVIGSLLSGVIGITMAATGFGVWSLATQQISNAFFRTVFLWLLNPWRPVNLFSLKSLREMFGFGSRLLASGLLNQIFDNIYLLVIGKLFSATDLGLFTRAKSLADIPSQTLSGMVAQVTFPVFATIQDDPARSKRGMKKALTTLVMVNFPMMIGLAAVARPLVLVLLTDRWAESIPYLQAFCFLGLLFPLHAINLNLLQALGRSDLFLRLEIIKKVLIVANIAVTWQWGVSAMIDGMIVVSLLSYYLNSFYTGMLIDYRIWEQLRDLLSYLIVAGLMGIAVCATTLFAFPNDWSMLLVRLSVGIVIYVCVCRLFRLAAFMETWQAGWNKVLFIMAKPAR